MNDDIVDKFKNILNEKGIDISSLTSAVNSNATDTSSASHSNSGFTGESSATIQAEAPSSSGFDIDINTILKLKNLIGTAQSKSSARVQLLEALKPFLGAEKRAKLDEYIKIANILSILEVVQENRR